MSEWNRLSLRDISTHIKDGTHGTHQRVASGVPFLSAKNIGSNGRLSWDKGDDLVSESDYSAITSMFTPKQGDVLLTVVGSIGRTALFDGSRVAFQRSVAFIRCNDDVLPAFLYQAISSADFVRQLEHRCNVTAQAGLYLGELAKCQISLPSIKQQTKIAAILTATDTAIEKTEALIDKYQQIKAGLMHDLFTRGVLPNGQLRPPREHVPELYQETAIGWIPSEWAIKDCSVILDSIADGPFGSNLKTEHYVVDPGIRVVRLQNVAEYQYNDGDRAYVSDRHAAYLVRNRVVGGDVLIAGLGEERYPVGRACIYPDGLPPAINKADCFRARCVAEVMHNKFLD